MLAELTDAQPAECLEAAAAPCVSIPRRGCC